MKRHSSALPPVLQLFRTAIRYVAKNRYQLFYFSAVPLFFILLSRLVIAYFPSGVVTTTLIFFLKFFNAVLMVVFSVQWLRLILLSRRETQIAVPSFEGRYLQYGVLMLGMFFIITMGFSLLFSLLRIHSFFVLGVLYEGTFLFLWARFSYSFVSVAIDRPFQIQQTWQKSSQYWHKLFAYLVLVEGVGLVVTTAIIGVLFVSQLQSFQDPYKLMAVLFENSWITEVCSYVFLALKLYGIAIYVKKSE